jgi:hypothetical protein
MADATKDRDYLSAIKKRYMKKMSSILIVFLITTFGCKKTGNNSATYQLKATDTIGIFGEWQWVDSRSGLFADSSSADSIITLTLNPDNSYAIGLNGTLKMNGTYKISVNSYNDSLIHFNNFQQTATSTQSGITYIQFGTYDIGRLIIFVDDELSINNNFLEFVSYPITPEAYIADFSKQ